MKSNKDLTINEFLCAQNLKRAMIANNLDDARLYINKAIKELYND
jgi:hypothetical protein